MAAAVMLALLLAEGATRLFRPQHTRHVGPLYQPDDSLGFVRMPNLHSRINVGEGWVTLATDHVGYRVGKIGRVEAENHVLVLGDSFMEARAVEYEVSVPGLLEFELSRQLGQAVAVRNNGVSGYGPDHYRLSGRRAFARERFDVVLVALYVGNDVIRKSTERFRPVAFNARPTPKLPAQWTPREFNRTVVMPIMLRLQQYSDLAALLWNATESIRPRLGLADWDFPQQILRGNAEGPQWAVTAETCARIVAMADSNHARAVFVVLPQYAQMVPEKIPAYARSYGVDPALVDVDQPNRLLTAALQSRGIHVIDALDALRRANRPGTPVFGRVDHHLSAAGHRVVADLVMPPLLEILRSKEPVSAQQGSQTIATRRGESVLPGSVPASARN